MRTRAVGLILLITATFAACRSGPEPVTVQLSSTEGLLPLAIQLADDVEDVLRRADALQTVSRAYLESGQEQDAAVVASEAARLVNALPLSPDVLPTQLDVAALFLELGQPVEARQLITEATAYLSTLRDENLLLTWVPAIVETALGGGESSRDLLPPAVDPVYVMEDAGLRARTFIAVAEVYQSGGLEQSVYGILQQSIPAIRSISDTFLKAELLADLSLRATVSGESDLADRLVVDAMGEFTNGLEFGEPGDSVVSSVFRAQTVLRGPMQAMLSIDVLQPVNRIGALVAIARASVRVDSSVLATRRAQEVAADLEASAEAARIHAAVARASSDAGNAAGALESAEIAVAIAADAGQPVLVDLIGQLSEVYITIAEIERLRDHITLIRDPYGRALASLRAAEALIRAEQMGVADDFLVEALLEADTAAFFSDELRVQVASGFARTGSVSLAIRTIERIEEADGRARATVQLARYASGRASAEQVEDLRDVLGL